MGPISKKDTVTKEILLQQPACTLQLERDWNEEGVARHSFKLYPCAGGRATGVGVDLLSGEGHEVPRREIHYALYLFQSHGANGHREKRVING